jgi:putative SOS response-associated peptidase YedK
MLKQIIAASALSLISFGPAVAQSTSAANQLPAASTAPATITTVEACEGQTRRLAGLNKGLGANYNAERVHNDCVASTSTNFASK